MDLEIGVIGYRHNTTTYVGGSQREHLIIALARKSLGLPSIKKKSETGEILSSPFNCFAQLRP